MSEEIKVGSYIAVSQRIGNVISLHKVIRETPTMFITKRYRFKKDGLKIFGAGSIGPYYGRPAKESDFMKHRILKASVSLEQFEVTENNIEAVEQFLRAEQ